MKILRIAHTMPIFLDKINKNIFFFIFTIFLLIILHNKYLYANNLWENNLKYCNELNYNNSLILTPHNFQKIEIHLFLNEKKFASLLANNFIELKKYNYVKNKGKKVKALLLLKIEDFDCYLKAKIRPHGDLIDHYEYSSFNNFRIPSLRVELIDTHIFGIVEFILFRPETRNSYNEIYINALFSELGYLAPRTSLAKVKFKNNDEQMLFQEVINKEFLENNSLSEGPIISGDERFVFETKLPELSWHKIDNRKWIKKNISNFDISKRALDIINYTYFNHFNISTLDDTQMVDYYTSTLGTNFNKLFDHLPAFDALLNSTLSLHGISRDDRRFYYDVTKNLFIPILYDSYSEQTDNLLNNFPNSKYFNESEKKILNSSLYGSQQVLKEIKNLNIENFKKNLFRKGFKLHKNNVENRIQKTINNLQFLYDLNKNKELNFNKNKLILPINFKKRNFFNKTILNNHISKTTKFIVTDNEKYEICDIKLYDCSIINLDIKQKELLLNQSLNLKIKNNNLNRQNLENNFYNVVYLGEKNRFIKSNINKYDSSLIINKKKSFQINSNFILDVYGDIELELDENNNVVNFFRKNKNSAVLIKNGKLKDWKFNFYDLSRHKDLNTFTISKMNGLNGCLNFYDTELTDIEVNSYNSSCEDSLNFVRTFGSIKKIYSNNSYSDAVDFDFSNVSIDQIKINNSGNDCVDFSSGDYQIDNIVLINCGDKAISLGENSKIVINNIVIDKSSTGIASKDYSSFNGFKVKISNVDTCLSAYNKKQEFSGGFIKIEKLICKNNLSPDFVDTQSQVDIANRNDF